jgi:cytochrome c
MKALIVSALAAVGFVAAGPASASAGSDLAKAKNCFACHAVDKKLVGPSYQDVAKKYAGQNVAAKLAEKVQKGGSGVWGNVPMPPNAVKPEEAKALVDWILSGAK